MNLVRVTEGSRKERKSEATQPGPPRLDLVTLERVGRLRLVNNLAGGRQQPVRATRASLLVALEGRATALEHPLSTPSLPPTPHSRQRWQGQSRSRRSIKRSDLALRQQHAACATLNAEPAPPLPAATVFCLPASLTLLPLCLLAPGADVHRLSRGQRLGSSLFAP